MPHEAIPPRPTGSGMLLITESIVVAPRIQCTMLSVEHVPKTSYLFTGHTDSKNTTHCTSLIQPHYNVPQDQGLRLLDSLMMLVQLTKLIVNELISPTVRKALFWAITQRVVVISYRRFGTTYRSHPPGRSTQYAQRRREIRTYTVVSGKPVMEKKTWKTQT